MWVISCLPWLAKTALDYYPSSTGGMTIPAFRGMSGVSLSFWGQTLKTPAMTKTWSLVRGSWNLPLSRVSLSSLTARAPAGRRKIPLVHEPSAYRNVSMSWRETKNWSLKRNKKMKPDLLWCLLIFWKICRLVDGFRGCCFLMNPLISCYQAYQCTWIYTEERNLVNKVTF